MARAPDIPAAGAESCALLSAHLLFRICLFNGRSLTPADQGAFGSSFTKQHVNDYATTTPFGHATVVICESAHHFVRMERVLMRIITG
jgi:hypothetical protein